jgi:glucosamine kinase
MSYPHILVVDAGGSKTAFCTNLNGWKETIIDLGFNAVWNDLSGLNEVLLKLPGDFPLIFDSIFFYGAGCFDIQTNQKINAILNERFISKHIEISDDLVGAARACLSENDGIICILGTGSISAKFKNGNIIDRIHTLGYLAGDHGSGAYLGRLIAQSWFYRELPDQTEYRLKEFLQCDQAEFKTALYKSSHPSAFIAKLSKFAALNKSDEKIRELINLNFALFVSRVIKKYQDWESNSIGFCGGFAFAFSELLLDICDQEGITVSEILEKPGEKLIEFHLNSTR